MLIVGLVLEFPADSPALESSGDPTELPAPPSSKQAGWIALQEKKKHDKANARKLTAAEASEGRPGSRRSRRNRYQGLSIKFLPRQLFVLLPAFLRLPRLLSQFHNLRSPEGGLKVLENRAPTSSAASPSYSARPVLIIFKSGGQIKEKKA